MKLNVKIEPKFQINDDFNAIYDDMIPYHIHNDFNLNANIDSISIIFDREYKFNVNGNFTDLINMKAFDFSDVIWGDNEDEFRDSLSVYQMKIESYILINILEPDVPDEECMFMQFAKGIGVDNDILVIYDRKPSDSSGEFICSITPDIIISDDILNECESPAHEFNKFKSYCNNPMGFLKVGFKFIDY